MHDAGVCRIYRVENTAEPGMKPVFNRLLKAEQLFEERTVGITRYNTALQNNQRIDLVARIWRDKSIGTDDRCEIDGLDYHIRQVQHTKNEDGILVTDLALERMDADEVT